jgi:hypothetical protein
MIRASVIVRTADECIYFSAIGTSTAAIAESVIDHYGVCAFTVRALP